MNQRPVVADPNESALASDMGMQMVDRMQKLHGHRMPQDEIEFAGMLGIAFMLGRESIAGTPESVPDLCSGRRLMALDSKPGTKIVFAYPDNGYSGDREHARKYLTLGHTYTVRFVEVGGERSSVYLNEVKGTCFNTVQFAPAEGSR